MYRYYFIFRSVTTAQRALQLLSRKGIEAALAPAPGLHASSGCGHAVWVTASRYASASAALRDAALFPLKVIRTNRDLSLEEVAF